MPYKDPEERNKKRREYYQNNKDKFKEWNETYKKNNPEKYKIARYKATKKWRENNSDKVQEMQIKKNLD